MAGGPILGTNLSSHPHLEFFQARTAEALKAQLDQVRLPYKLIAIYAVGNAHFAWVSLTRKIIKKPKEE